MKIDTSLGLPACYTEWRDDQYRAVDAVVKSDKEMFLLDAPTGVGKSLLAIGAHRILQQQCIYITRTKQLQDQIMRDFSSIAVSLKGKANYPCLMRYEMFPDVTADDCPFVKASNCERYGECPYYCAKAEAKIAPLVVLNDAYFLAEANGDFSTFGDNELLVVDEVDSIEAGLMSYIQFTITLKQLQKFGLHLPENPDNKWSWMRWIPGAIDTLKPWLDNCADQLKQVNPSFWGPSEIEINRQMKRTNKLIDKLFFLKREVDESWIFFVHETRDGTEWVFKPVIVGRYGKQYLWDHGDRSLGMSGTIFEPSITCVDLGIADCDYMKLDSPFPVENRPIFFKPVVNLTRKTMDYELPILSKEVDDILEKYPDEKVLIHTVSYKVRDYLMATLNAQWRLATHSSQTREAALAEFKASKDPIVMLSPSFDRGVDLPIEDNVGCVIVCKMPFLDLSDPQIKARMGLKDGGRWYALKTGQTLVQMCGRHVRSKRQRGDTWILDSQFSRLRRQLSDVLPGWWLNAVQDLPVGKRADQLI